jgi:hypothetical protein
MSQQTVGEDRWYLIRLSQLAADCSPSRVSAGTEGWASNILLSESSYSVEEYATLSGITLPTAIVAPTAVPKPTARPQPTARPAPAPSTGGGRIGAICRDGTRSYATGRGACSHHGGVDYWLYGP